MTPTAPELADWLVARVSAAGARGLVVRLDGSVESAVVLRLCQMAAPGCTLAVIVPPDDDGAGERVASAARLAEQVGVPTLRIDLGELSERLQGDLARTLSTLPGAMLPPRHDVDPNRAGTPAEELVQRLRMAVVYGAADTLTYLVAGAATRSDLMIGAFTKFGDGGVDVLPLGGMSRQEVRVLASSLGVPRAILDDPPRARLWSRPVEDGGPGFAAADLERYLELGPEGVPPATALRIERLIRNTDHKRARPAVPE